MSEKKLYYVEFTYGAYVYTESEDRAEEFAWEICREEEISHGSATEILPGQYMDARWDGQCLVYHDGREDLHLADVWPKEKVPDEPEIEVDPWAYYELQRFACRKELKQLGCKVSFRNRDGKLYAKVDGTNKTHTYRLLRRIVERYFPKARSTSGSGLPPASITMRLNP